MIKVRFNTLSAFFTGILLAGNISAQRIESIRPPFFNTIEEANDEIHDWFAFQRILPFGKIDDAAYRHAARERMRLTREAGFRSTTSWQNSGPVNIGGRLTDVEMNRSGFNVLYACAASGGIFKSGDAGLTWTPIFDQQPSLSIGDLAISLSNENILYAGTGEPNAGGGSLTYDGMGVFKSVDGGTTWTDAGLTLTRNIGRIAIHPSNPDEVYVAAMGDLFANNAERGLYKTTDGGATWQNVFFMDDSTGVIDVAIDPNSPSTIYACSWTRVRRIDRRNYGGPASGLWKSTDAGATWSQIGTANGLPGNFEYGRTCIGISESQPNTLYYMVSNQTSNFMGVYRSDDFGQNWSRTNDSLIGDVFNGASHWEGRIKVDPVDPDVVYLIGFDTWKTDDGGQNWNNISFTEHPDNHEVFIHPSGNQQILLANDAGLYQSFDGGATWQHNETLPVTQFYTVETNEFNTLIRGGGTQDNGVIQTNTAGIDDWYQIWGGDGFYVLFDPFSGMTYCESQYGNINTGTAGVDPAARFNWNTPLAFNPSNYNSIFLGANQLYKSTDQGANWYPISPDLTDHTLFGYPITWGTMTSISVAPSDTNVIYCGTDDGNVWVTQNHGVSWQKINPMTAVRWVTRVTADPLQAGTVYVTFSGYRFHDMAAHVYRSTDFGATWTAIDGNLPDLPCNDLLVDPDHPNTLYLATDVGVYFSYDLGSTWNLAGTNMPIVPVTDLRFHNPTRTLFAATYGRSIYTMEVDPLFTGIQTTEIAQHDLIVSPNPFRENLFVQCANSTEPPVHVTMFTAAGQVFFDRTISQLTGSYSIDLSDEIKGISSGVYYVTIETRTERTTRKLVKLVSER